MKKFREIDFTEKPKTKQGIKSCYISLYVNMHVSDLMMGSSFSLLQNGLNLMFSQLSHACPMQRVTKSLLLIFVLIHG